MGKTPDKPKPKRISTRKLKKMIRQVEETQAFCTDCKEWYNSSNTAESRKHAH